MTDYRNRKRKVMMGKMGKSRFILQALESVLPTNHELKCLHLGGFFSPLFQSTELASAQLLHITNYPHTSGILHLYIFTLQVLNHSGREEIHRIYFIFAHKYKDMSWEIKCCFDFFASPYGWERRELFPPQAESICAQNWACCEVTVGTGMADLKN